MKRRIVVHEGGLVCHGLTATTQCLWTDVTGVYVIRAGFPPSTDVRIDLASGKQLELPSMVRGLEEIAGRIVSATTPLIKAKIEAALERGETVAFGPNLSVNAKGMQFRPNGPKGKELKMRWEDVDDFIVGQFRANSRVGGGIGGAILVAQVRISSRKAKPPLWLTQASSPILRCS